VCVFDGTYYKITTTNYISNTSLDTTFHMYPWGPRRPLLHVILHTVQLDEENQSILIGQGGLLLVVPHLFAVPVFFFLIRGGVKKK
jgi:hypothetical protein